MNDLQWCLEIRGMEAGLDTEPMLLAVIPEGGDPEGARTAAEAFKRRVEIEGGTAEITRVQRQ